ncbi:hypothetical protein PHYSODRAFT_262595 [Phytophthora sojae]|uniref:Uncharacterized protein n=1 Tax=Phytophthora sojae (strain P6497) TaxID=1094619 RepID=G4ZDY9_PHYSP|nr:hypothetical protein PHYSODRAFT_262595 [Phytophthora sojae]EGZ16514.1 hypothetical protein PHYSODRAFT_262595 [Phytophthora sojae]|eukprot:XP_009525572.1 hypothetical protein PHYSODRAFT_262595 [Phytophthora sojae]
MDYRSTGRSTFLDCVAAQATTTGFPNGQQFDPSEVPACAQELENEYGDLASFSVTSAATDVTKFISGYTSSADTIIYVTGYGTWLAERLMHLAPPKVTGYVLDGIATTSGSPAEKFMYTSTWDTDFGEVGDQFLDLCSRDKTWSSRFKKSNTLPKVLQKLLAEFDKNPNSTCATILTDGTVMPSVTLRSTLSTMLMDDEQRKLIPPLVYRLNRCNKRDVDVLTNFVEASSATTNSKSQDDSLYSPLLYYLLNFSEMWETPSSSMQEMEKQVEPQTPLT